MKSIQAVKLTFHIPPSSKVTKFQVESLSILAISENLISLH